MEQYHRIGTTLGDNGEFDVYNGYIVGFHNISEPTLPRYSPYAAVQQRADYGQSLRGPAFASLFWDELDHHEYEELRTIVEAGRAAGIIYLTIDLVHEQLYALGTWADLSGKPQILRATPRPNSNGHWYDDVVFEVQNTTIVNNPALNI